MDEGNQKQQVNCSSLQCMCVCLCVLCVCACCACVCLCVQNFYPTLNREGGCVRVCVCVVKGVGG